MLWKSKTVRFLSPGDEENLRIAGQLPHDLGTAHKVSDSENVLAIEQHSVRHNDLHEYTRVKLSPKDRVRRAELRVWAWDAPDATAERVRLPPPTWATSQLQFLKRTLASVEGQKQVQIFSSTHAICF